MNTLLVNGTDLRSLSYMRWTRIEVFAPGTLRGANDPIPGADGDLPAALPRAAYRFSAFGILIDSTGSVAQYNANLAALGAIVANGSGGTVTLERRLDKVGGGYNAHTSTGQFIGGLTPDPLNGFTGRFELQFWNLRGAWFSAGAPTVPIVP